MTMRARLWVAILPALTACLSLEREAPNPQRFVLEAQRQPAEPDGPARTAVLEVQRFRVAPAWDGLPLAYRTSDARVETDFYNAFLVPPGPMLTEVTRQWLYDSGAFGRVQGAGQETAPTHLLEADVRALYGDLRGEVPAAVLALTVVVTRAGSRDVVLQRTYEEHAPLANDDAGTLVAGFNLALRRILARLEQDLRAAV
jgi:cholesterol transport system auxiliary component